MLYVLVNYTFLKTRQISNRDMNYTPTVDNPSVLITIRLEVNLSSNFLQRFSYE